MLKKWIQCDSLSLESIGVDLESVEIKFHFELE